MGLREGQCRELQDMINYHPRISFVVATKMHDKRFYRADQKIVSNTMPGDVVDAGVVRTDIPEFFMQSHFPLKGLFWGRKRCIQSHRRFSRCAQDAAVVGARQRARHECQRDSSFRKLLFIDAPSVRLPHRAAGTNISGKGDR